MGGDELERSPSFFLWLTRLSLSPYAPGKGTLPSSVTRGESSPRLGQQVSSISALAPSSSAHASRQHALPQQDPFLLPPRSNPRIQSRSRQAHETSSAGPSPALGPPETTCSLRLPSPAPPPAPSRQRWLLALPNPRSRNDLRPARPSQTRSPPRMFLSSASPPPNRNHTALPRPPHDPAHLSPDLLRPPLGPPYLPHLPHLPPPFPRPPPLPTSSPSSRLSRLGGRAPPRPFDDAEGAQDKDEVLE